MVNSPDGSAAFRFPKPPLDAVAKDEERRESAKKNLVRALQSYLNKLDKATKRDAHRETELFCDYACENYASRAEPYFEVMPQIDPAVLFRIPRDSKRDDLSDLGELSGLPTVGDVVELAKSITARRPKHWPDGPIYRDGETPEMRRVIRELVIGKHVSFKLLLEEPEGNWFRQQLRDCVVGCVREKRAAYEQRFPYPSAVTNSPSSIPHLPLAVHESVDEIDGRTRRLLKGCRNIAPGGHRLSFNVGKAIEILRTCAAETFDKKAEYFVSLEAFRPQWLREVADQTLTATLELVDPLDLIWQSVPEMEAEVRRTLEASLGEWEHSPPKKQAVEPKPPEEPENSAEPNPFPADHPAHQVWEGLPRKARESLPRRSSEYRAEILEFDKTFQEKFAETASLDLLERYCLGRFDLLAGQMLPGSVSTDPTSVNARYESYLESLQQKGQEFPRTVLRALRSEVREEIVSRIALKLSSRKLHWMREAINWRLQGCPPRSPSNVNRYFHGDAVPATETGSSLDHFVRRVADELERKGSSENIAGTVPATGARGAETNHEKVATPGDVLSKRTETDGNPVSKREPGEKKKRGRPQIIPDERKTAARGKKLEGGSNLDAAKLLYDKLYPTPQEVKNVPSILNHFETKLTELKRAAAGGAKRSRKTNKTKG